MSRRNFETATYGSTVTFDLDQSHNWQVTLAGSPTFVFAGGQEGDVINIMVIQDGTGSRSVTWDSDVTWSASAAPALKTAANAVDVFTFVRKGSVWRDVGGGSSTRFPRRIQDAGLGTIIGVAATVMTLQLSAGGGVSTEIGAVKAGLVQQVGTGANVTVVYVREGSGGIMLSKSGADLGVGVANLSGTPNASKPETALFHVNATNGNVTDRGLFSGASLKVEGGLINSTSNGTGVLEAPTLSGGTVYVNRRTAGSGRVLVWGTDGGKFCLQDTDGAGWTACDALNGTLTCRLVVAGLEAECQ